MKSLRLILIYLFSLLIISCNQEPQKEIVSKYSDNSPHLIRYYIINDLKQKVIVKEIEYYQGNIKKVEGTFKNGLKNGKWTYWYDNGNKWSEGTFFCGLSHGRFSIWKDDGSRNFSSHYKFGKPNGKWMFWNNEGRIVKIVTVQNKNIIKQVSY